MPRLYGLGPGLGQSRAHDGAQPEAVQCSAARLLAEGRPARRDEEHLTSPSARVPFQPLQVGKFWTGSAQTGSEWNSPFPVNCSFCPVLGEWEKSEDKLKKAKKNETKTTKKKQRKAKDERKKTGEFLRPHLYQPHSEVRATGNGAFRTPGPCFPGNADSGPFLR